MYELPHPLIILQDPMDKETFKKLVKKKLVSYWEMQLRSEAGNLPSLSFFQPAYVIMQTASLMVDSWRISLEGFHGDYTSLNAVWSLPDSIFD